MLSCSCREADENDAWFWWAPSDFTKLKTRRRKRCLSCDNLIDVGADCVEIERGRYPEPDSIEEKIYSEDTEIKIASWYFCEHCGEIFLNLSVLGYCLPGDWDMRKMLKDYHKMTGFQSAVIK